MTNYRKQKFIHDPKTVLGNLKSIPASTNQPDGHLEIYQTLLSNSSGITKENSSDWQPVLVQLLKIIISNGKVRDQEILLASRVYFTISSAIFPLDEVKNHIDFIINHEDSSIFIFNEEFRCSDPESISLIMIHGYLLVNKKSIYCYEICRSIFRVIQRNCVAYTKYTHFSYRMLNFWLKFTKTTDFWSQNDSTTQENLEAVLFSNWDNCINDVARINASEIFPSYLEIMNGKYPGFSKEAWDSCEKNLSWLSSTKYTILMEICRLLDHLPELSDTFLTALIGTLRKNHLKHSGTKLYISILRKMDSTKWRKVMMAKILEIVGEWDSENEVSPDDLLAINFLWDLWMKPTLKIFDEELMIDLWRILFRRNKTTCQAYLLKIATDQGISQEKLLDSLREEDNVENRENNIWIAEKGKVPFAFNDIRECVRSIAFEIHCKGTQQDYEIIKCFLRFNAKASSSKLRKSIFESFKILMEKISKCKGAKENEFIEWLHSEFLVDCFEIGSCYQRKIVGLNLYGIMLSVSGNNPEKISKKTNFNCSLNDRKSLLTLTRLCLDPIEDIRNKASDLLLKYFNPKILYEGEIVELTSEALKKSKSSSFYEIAGGSKLLKVFSSWNHPTDTSTQNYPQENSYLLEAKKQLVAMQEDLLKATTQGSSFYGSVLTMTERIETLKNSFHLQFKILDLLDEAAKFFLSTLSLKFEDTSIVYSSSFAEMGIAIDKIIRQSEITDEFDACILSPAHQTVLSCIWNSLRAICDLAAELSYVTPEKSEKEMQIEAHRKSINIVVTILMRCRHKGVIESAGSSLARLMKNENIDSDLFLVHLEKLLNLNSSDKVDLTRRGAGQTIMFHKMMANDTKTHRFLNTALDKLLNSLRNERDEKINGKNSNQDDPRARQLHFLRTIVADKSLHPQLAHFLEEISIICLENIQSTEWSIRNASLQLLGAIIPRIVDQGNENDLDFGIGCSINHFFTHYPKLSEKVMETLNDRTNDFDGSIVPVLTLLSKMSTAGWKFVDGESGIYTLKIKSALRSLFDHRVGIVRDLAAKAYAALVEPRSFIKMLLVLNTEISNSYLENYPNYLHGQLSMQTYLQIRAKYELISLEEDDQQIFDEMLDERRKRVSKILDHFDSDQRKSKNINYIVETTFLKCLSFFPYPFEFLLELLTEKVTENSQAMSKIRPGYLEFHQKLSELSKGINLMDSDEFNKQPSSAWNLLKNTKLAWESGYDESSINFLNKSAYSDDEVQRRMAMDYLFRNSSELDNFSDNDYFTKCARTFVLNCFVAIIVLLNDEVPEIREKISGLTTKLILILESVEPNSSGRQSRMPKNIEVCLDDFLKIIVELIDDDSEKNARWLWDTLFPPVNIANEDQANILESPFGCSEIYREETKIMNTLFFFIQRRKQFQVSSVVKKNNLDVEDNFQDKYIESLQNKWKSELVAIFNIKPSDYLNYKNSYFREKIVE